MNWEIRFSQRSETNRIVVPLFDMLGGTIALVNGRSTYKANQLGRAPGSEPGAAPRKHEAQS